MKKLIAVIGLLLWAALTHAQNYPSSNFSTPAIFDNTTRAATTAFVQRNGVAYRNSGFAIGANLTLNTGHAGSWGQFQAAGVTATLPLLSTIPIGQTITFLGGSVGGTVAASGSDAIIRQDAVGVFSIYVGPSQTVTLASNGNGSGWFITNTGYGREHACANILDYGGDASGTNTNTAAYAAAAAAGPAGRKCVYFPPGRFRFNTAAGFTFTAALQSIMLQGSGSDVTELFFPNNATGLIFTYAGPYDSTHIHDLTVTTGVANSASSAINLFQSQVTIPNPGNSATSEIMNVTVRGSDGYSINNYWANNIVVNSVSAVNFINVTIFGFGGAGNGINIFGSNTAIPVVYNLSNCTINGTNVGLVYGNNVQGVTVNQSNFTGNNYGIYAPAAQSSLDQLSVTGSQFNNFLGNINLNTEIQNTNITNNLFLVQPNTFAIYMPKTAMFAIIGNTFEQATGTITGTNGITVFGWQYGGGIITANGFYGLITGVWIQAGARNVNVQGNVYQGLSNTIVNSCTSGCSIGVATQ